AIEMTAQLSAQDETSERWAEIGILPVAPPQAPVIVVHLAPLRSKQRLSHRPHALLVPRNEDQLMALVLPTVQPLPGAWQDVIDALVVDLNAVLSECPVVGEECPIDIEKNRFRSLVKHRRFAGNGHPARTLRPDRERQ